MTYKSLGLVALLVMSATTLAGCEQAEKSAQQLMGQAAETAKQAIDYKASDGLKIHAYLTLPPFKDPKNLPLIVLPHGGPESRDTLAYDWQAQVFASRS